MNQDLSTRLFNPRLSMFEAGILVFIAVILSWYFTTNSAAYNQQRILYESSVIIRADAIAESILQQKEDHLKAEFSQTKTSAMAIAHEQIPEPKMDENLLKVAIFGPDDDYLSDLRNAVKPVK